MALLWIRGDDGKDHLVHSSMIGPQFMPIRSSGHWKEVWDGFDAERMAAEEKFFHDSPWPPET